MRISDWSSDVCSSDLALQVRGESPGLNPGIAFKTASLESRRGEWNSECRGEIRRYSEEHQWRRRLTGLVLTLRCESRSEEHTSETPVTNAHIVCRHLLETKT